MISIDEIKKKAENKFLPFLHSIIDEKNFFPLLIPSAKGSVKDAFDERKLEAEKLYKDSKNAKGIGYTVETKTLKTHKQGMQTIIEKIYFETEIDFISFIGKEKETENFKKHLSIVKKQFSNLNAEDIQNDWLNKHLRNLITEVEADYWQNIFRCAIWFLNNPNCNLYLREIPLSVHTKFIEQNTSLIFSVYTVLNKNKDKINSNADIYKRWRIRTPEPFIRFRCLDKDINLKILNEEIASYEAQIPLGAFAKINFNSVEYIFIVENLMVYLTLPPFSKALCIFGSGFAAVNLKENKALNEKKLYYFGDMDEHGFEILSNVRGIFPNVKSFCMDKKTYETFSIFAVRGENSHSKIEDLNLNEEELILFKFLRERTGRLEQEKISHAFIKSRMEEIFNNINEEEK
ncbi:hypothetical protein E4O03_01260 [Treponema sp. OMZ 792]|uniref:Wadjet anti-phage system protein JetD domain-containing protein n=1 Tax=unclassified Treponema TaxID=2638727 RepID=UPI0020A33C89|nr:MULTISPECIES: Wadjet anti-phage system protein JetD domain-containing protein [unclassified Treponema]UTC75389.1 hypothetical protein E4O03_01260 [Treponema sp. OMZ 792]UTC79392.1 hypothetical protein E4O07_01285 [Treponema sp. OMZ 798]